MKTPPITPAMARGIVKNYPDYQFFTVTLKPLPISQAMAQEIVKHYPGNQFFTVTFVKRSTGETRVMNCRKGVRSKGPGELKFDPVEKRLVSVYDMQKGEFRFISLDEIRRIAMQGKVFEVVRGY